ncbi:hypothetical protein [Polaromonas jejuensis]|uniref:Tip attachment protein J domain-containing protein n=1 Tax=Polaromonas jejuensis TaxID=457502 RepID=A0ABW0QGU7_9BURK|nr:hypothetical protein [Polaromonas jejuensis]
MTAGQALLGSIAVGLIGSSLASNAAKRAQQAAAAAQRAQYNASLQDRNVTGLSAEAPWQVVYGNPSPIGGSLCAILSSGAKSEFKHLLVVFAAHECQAIDEVYLDGNAVGALDGLGWVTGGTFSETAEVTTTEYIVLDVNGVGTASHAISRIISTSPPSFTTAVGNAITVNPASQSPDFIIVSYAYTVTTPRVNVQKHLSPGGVDANDQFIAARTGGAWGAADRLSGYTYIWLTLDQNFARFQGGPPNVTARLRGKKIYDWRTGTTVYSNNPALCLADFITSEAGFGATTAQIDSASVIAAANAADAAGFLSDGSFKTDQARENTKQQLEDSFGATCHQSGGVWRIVAGAWTTPVLSLTDADLAAPIQIEQASYNSKERFNTVRGKYVDGGGLGVATDFTPWQNTAEVASDGLVKVKDISFAFTKDHQRTQDLARMIVERSRGGLTITYPGHMRLWPLQPGDRVSITNAEFGWAAKTFRVTDWSFHPKTPVALQMVEDVAVYYNAAAVITADAAPNTNLPSPFDTPALAGLTAASGTAQLIKQADGSIITRVLLQWVATASQYVVTGGRVQIQYRLASALDDVWQTVTLPGDAASAYISNLTDGVTYLFRARFVSQLKIPGTWATIAHQVIGKIEPPTAPSNVSLTQSLVFWAKVTDIDLAGYLIRSQPGMTGIWSRGTPLHDGIVTAMPFALNQRLYGMQTIMVASIDTTGNTSAAVSATLDFGQPDSSNFVQVSDYQARGWPGTVISLLRLRDGTLLVDRFSESVTQYREQPVNTAGGALVADALASSDEYAIADLYGEPDVYATQYDALTWTSAPFLPQYGGGTLSLNCITAGPTPTIEYRTDGDNIINLYGSADVYASTDLYGPPGAYQSWPGALTINRMVGIQWRVSIAGGSEQGKVTTFTASLAAQEGGQTFANQAISSAGTRLSPSAGIPARTWIALRSVQITPFVDGSGAIAGRLLDFNTNIGPLTQLVDNTGTAVNGTATIDLKGLVDV